MKSIFTALTIFVLFVAFSQTSSAQFREQVEESASTKITTPKKMGPSGFIVDLLDFSSKENPHARQRTLPANPWPLVALEGC